MKRILLTFLFILSFTSELFAVNIQDRIETQNFYKKIYPVVFGNPDYALKKDFKNLVKEQPKKIQKKIKRAVANFDHFLPEKIMRPFLYWRYIKNDEKKTSLVLQYYMLYKLLVLRDYIDNPTLSGHQSILNLLRSLSNNPDMTTENLYASSINDIKDKANLLVELEEESFIQAMLSTKLITINLMKEIPNLMGHSLSSLGIISGNDVEIVSENDRSLERIQWFNERVIFNGGTLDFDAPYIKMPVSGDSSGHIAFRQDPIFQRIGDMIGRAQHSIFIDIFLFGGTMGATLSEYLLDQTILKLKTNPDFKVLLLHDYATNYNMKDEMMPIFAYIKNRIERESELKGNVFLLQANIQRHPPGIPFGLSNLIPKTDETFPELEKRNTYYESKIDHSKVIVIDGNHDNVEAYFGSKNWSDHSGGYYYDDAIWVKGPAAALVQASYYDDIDAALTTDKEEQKWFFYKEDGYDNKAYLPIRDKILSAFKITRSDYPDQGDEKVRLAEANMDGTIKNVRNILIDMIMHAEKSIYMEQLFLYDKYIVDALIKRKIRIPSLDIKLSIDHNGNFGLNGLPNTIFIKELKSYGIEVKARKLLGVTAVFPNGKEQSYHQENHRKITSVDGKVLLGGSSNINPDTLQGSFREFGAQIFSEEEIADFNSRFLHDWNDPDKMEDLDIQNFQAIIAGKKVPKKLSALINDIAAFLIRAKDKLERRY